MFLRKSLSHGKVYLSFVQGYRDQSGNIKQKTIQKLGYLDDLKNKYDDPVTHFKQIAKNNSTEIINEYTIKNITSKKIDNNSFNTKNLGYIILKKLYNELGLPYLFKSKNKSLNIDYDLNSVFELLIYSRILFPASKNKTYENKDIFFEDFDFSLKDLYRSLDYFSKYKDDIETLLWNNTKDKYNRDTSTTYYDCTNYYFEISYNDEDLIDEEGNILKKAYRKKGPSKEQRKSPIISMGLLMDNNGIPLSYDLFPGNESEKTQLRPTLTNTKAKFGIDKTIIVADRGLNTTDNTFFIAHKNDDDHPNHDGYVYGQSILGADKEFKDYVLNPDGYISDFVFDKDNKQEFYKEEILDDVSNVSRYETKPVIFKHKSRVVAKNIKIKKDDKRIVNYLIYQKQMVYYSKKYADRQKRLREQAIEKARDLIKHPSKYNKSTSYGACAYVNNIKFVKSTGDIPDGLDLSLNQSKIDEEALFDGYYSIVTSEKDFDDKKIRDIYKGLWEIEETFKITKSNLETRPVFVHTSEHIDAHFLSCFVSLVIVRLLEKITNEKYSVNLLLDSLKKYNTSNIEHDLYLQTFNNDVIRALETIFNITLSRKYFYLSEIKKL